jgi:hypothetical protein
METWLASWLASTIVWLALLRIRFYIHLVYTRKAEDDTLRVEVYALKKLLYYYAEIPVLKIDKENMVPWFESEVEAGKDDVQTKPGREQVFLKNTFHMYLYHPRQWRQLQQEFKYYLKLYRQLMDKIFSFVTCEKLIWRTSFGSEDAAVTGMVTGLAWAIKNWFYLGLKRRLKRISKPVFSVTPLFGSDKIEIDFQCIFSIRLGHVINALFSLVNLPWKGVTGSERTSNSKLNENSYGKY